MSSHKDIIDELVALHPDWANRREELAHLLTELERAKPDVQPSAGFQQSLLEQLEQRMNQVGIGSPSYFSSLLSLMDQRVFFAVGGAAVGVFVAVLWPHISNLPTNVPERTVQQQGADVRQAEPQAFGSLAFNTAGQTASSEESGAAGAVMGRGGGDMAAEGDAMRSSMVLPPEEYYVTQYEFDGDIELPGDDVQVYRRLPPATPPSAAGLNFGFANNLLQWSALGNLRVRQMQLEQTGDDPYMVAIDYREGTLNIHRERGMLREDSGCADPECFDRNRLRESDMLSDAAIMQATEQFVQQFGLNMSQYGEPTVMDDWRLRYEQAENKAQFYFPAQVNVVYPLLIDGKPVYEQHGRPFGVNVAVDVRTGEVSNLYNYFVQRYENSAYAPLTNQEEAREVLQDGSLHSWHGPDAKTATATLGEPTEGYMTYHKWNPETNSSTNLFIPALIFPVVERGENAMDHRPNVVVPLAAEIYEDRQKNRPVPRPMPVEPMDAPATEPAVLEEKAL